MSSRYWCFTLNNPSVNNAEIIQCLILDPRVQFLFCALEKGAQNQVPHYQGYLELVRHKMRSTVKNMLPANPHLETRKGTAKQALTYCQKDLLPDQLEMIPQEYSSDYIPSFLPLIHLPDIITINTASQSVKEILLDGKSRKPRKDERLLDLKAAIDCGKTNIELTDLDFPMWLQYQKHLESYRVLKSIPRDHTVNVIVIWGPTGTGKSKYAKEMFPGAYWKQRSNWWDNYADHETVIIDEFYGWLPFDLLLRVCDRYPLLLETKGGQVNFTAKTIVFTTNTIPERWYKNVYFKSFIRRVTSWIIMPVFGEKVVTDEYEQAHTYMSINEF